MEWIAPSDPKGVVAMRPLRSRRAITLDARGARTVPPHFHTGRALSVVLAGVLLFALAGVLMFAAPAASLDQREQTLAAMTNTARLRHDLPRLIGRARLRAAAERQSVRMAKRGRLFHGSLAWTSGRRCWGQNVGKGPTIWAVVQAFMRSPDHRANMLDRCYRGVGYGVVKVRGAVWVTANFAG
jgi:cysteine-rich secretory family protein